MSKSYRMFMSFGLAGNILWMVTYDDFRRLFGGVGVAILLYALTDHDARSSN